LINTSTLALILLRGGVMEQDQRAGEVASGMAGKALWLARVSFICAIAVVALGALVLAGWAIKIEPLKRVAPGLVAMNPVTALAFILAGVVLFLARETPDGCRRTRITFFCGSMMTIVGSIKVASYLFGWDVPIDQWLFAGQLNDSNIPNRIAPNSALNLLLSGLALSLLDVETRGGHRPAQFLALGVSVLALIAITGYAFGTALFYRVTSFIPMALHTAVGFLLLAVGLLCARPRRGIVRIVSSDGVGGKMVRRLLPAAVVVPALLGWLRLLGQRAGHYDASFGVSLMVVSSIAIFGGIIFLNALVLEKADDERRKAQLALAAASEEQQRFFTLSLDMFCIAGFDGYFKRLNPAWEKALGFSIEELTARPYAEFVHPEDHGKTNQEAEKVAGGAKAISFENRYRCKDGSYRWLLWNAVPLVEQGLIYAVARDITEGKEAEQKIKNLNEDLEHRAQLLETANKELEAFSYSVSHDLRAPLRHIDGYADLVRKGPGAAMNETGRRYLDTISDSAKQMGRLIDDLLVFSRMGRTELRQTKVELDALVEETIRSLKTEIDGRNVVWKRNPLPQVFGDSAMLRQVFANLLGNAVKYSKPRDPAVIEIGCQSEIAQEWVIFVRDNGVGFDMQFAQKLFGVFQRLHSSDDFEGTGIGLANVRRIIQRHGGRTWAEGKVDEGSTFCFSLPRKSERKEEQRSEYDNIKTNTTGGG